MGVSDMLSSVDYDKLSILGTWMFRGIVVYVLFTIFVVAFGGLFGFAIFGIILTGYGVSLYRKKNKASQIHNKLMSMSRGRSRLDYSVKMVSDTVIVDFGQIQLAGSVLNDDTMSVLMRDMITVIRYARKSGKLPQYSLESEVIAEYVTNIGMSVENARTLVRKAILMDLNKLMEYGFFDEMRDINEICRAVRGTASMYDRRKYDNSVINRVVDNVEIELVKKLHENSSHVVVKKE